MNLSQRKAAWLQRLLPQAFALEKGWPMQLALVSLLLCGLESLWNAPPLQSGPRFHYLSIAGLLLPDAVLANQTLFRAMGLAFLGSAVAWALSLLMPYSAWIATLAFLAATSMIQESRVYTVHTVHVTASLLLILCVWRQIHRRQGNRAGCRGLLLGPQVCPSWVPFLCAFYLGFSYCCAGLTKLFYSGWAWSDGLALQLWVWELGDHSRPLVRLILADRHVAGTMQLAVLLAEVFALLALASRRASVVIGAVLFGFHVCSELLFGFGFYANIAATGIFLVFHPIYVSRTARNLVANIQRDD